MKKGFTIVEFMIIFTITIILCIMPLMSLSSNNLNLDETSENKYVNKDEVETTEIYTKSEPNINIENHGKSNVYVNKFENINIIPNQNINEGFVLNANENYIYIPKNGKCKKPFKLNSNSGFCEYLSNL